MELSDFVEDSEMTEQARGHLKAILEAEQARIVAALTGIVDMAALEEINALPAHVLWKDNKVAFDATHFAFVAKWVTANLPQLHILGKLEDALAAFIETRFDAAFKGL